MTFLGWMHKLMHNSTEPMKNSTLGNPSTCFSVQTLFDEQNYHVEPTKTLSRSNINCQKSSKRFDSNKVEALFQEELFEPFEFLAIGTFGKELNTDPPTPTLPVPPENLINQQMEITEVDLNLINYELERFLEAEEKEIANDTSERSSQASFITLINKPFEGADGADSEGHTCLIACPLKSYLFATSIEVAKPDKEVKKEKTSLEELFKSKNIAHDDPTRKSAEAEQQPRKRRVAHFMKKMVKKFHSSSSSSTASKNVATVSLSVKKKLSKALKMLHRKVHPQEVAEKQFVNIQKSEKKEMPHENACKIEGDDEIEMIGQAATRKNGKNARKLSSSGICKDAPRIDGGHWIKTDSDYLVLEL